MATLIVGKSLKDDDILWRYLSLDKLIDLVESKTLFFAPLAWFAQTDPFEGYLPRVAMQAMASISINHRDQSRMEIDKLAQMLPASAGQDLLQLRRKVEAQVQTMKEIYKNIASCLMVNCWFKGEHESEGMWGLYSKSGVAIRTSVGALKAALADNDQSCVIHVGTIKYLNFADESLNPSDCVTEDGHLIGMTKRLAYAHENEVRMYITGDRPTRSLDMQKPAPIKVDVNLGELLEAIVVSPFAGELIERSVRAVCRWGGVDQRIVSKSKLLDNCEYLLDVYE